MYYSSWLLNFPESTTGQYLVTLSPGQFDGPSNWHFSLFPGRKMDFEVKAKEILRAEMARQGLTIAALADRLSEIGAPEAVQSLGVKISRGKFQVSFLLRCLAAMGVDKVSLDIPSRAEALESKPALRSRPRAYAEEQERQRFVKHLKNLHRAKKPVTAGPLRAESTQAASTSDDEVLSDKDNQT